jgi:hypothetical protein
MKTANFLSSQQTQTLCSQISQSHITDQFGTNQVPVYEDLAIQRDLYQLLNGSYQWRFMAGQLSIDSEWDGLVPDLWNDGLILA